MFGLISNFMFQKLNLQILFLDCLKSRLGIIYELVFSLSILSCRRLQFDNVSCIKTCVGLSLNKIVFKLIFSFDFVGKVLIYGLKIQKELIVLLKFHVSVFSIRRSVSLWGSLIWLLRLVFLDNCRACILELLFEESWVRSLSRWFIKKW